MFKSLIYNVMYLHCTVFAFSLFYRNGKNVMEVMDIELLAGPEQNKYRDSETEVYI